MALLEVEVNVKETYVQFEYYSILQICKRYGL